MRSGLIIVALTAWCLALICIAGSFLMPDTGRTGLWLVSGFGFGMAGLVVALINLWRQRRGPD
ncbi:hypothetical protein [Acetobacter fallax]|uniref:Uncharacterized protein n=1 Tax=Acetobacter fallax TaxID=1737473 RepID=A0ABX0KEQ4_9PROT|nr:hypothetical protein [Acetobacter fallax]NHO33588.1 hypothetical protein [Acetobacter fallax]NHO37166.1 hypothetical protein [Acetobacter fallax]